MGSSSADDKTPSAALPRIFYIKKGSQKSEMVRFIVPSNIKEIIMGKRSYVEKGVRFEVTVPCCDGYHDNHVYTMSVAVTYCNGNLEISGYSDDYGVHIATEE
ncbi:MAG: hypothetical protein HYW88_02555 [Candidatus Sungbacteria bacterium]|nr:hypothetical protein [Candidatus Sungbacteria bacterium]